MSSSGHYTRHICMVWRQVLGVNTRCQLINDCKGRFCVRLNIFVWVLRQNGRFIQILKRFLLLRTSCKFLHACFHTRPFYTSNGWFNLLVINVAPNFWSGTYIQRKLMHPWVKLYAFMLKVLKLAFKLLPLISMFAIHLSMIHLTLLSDRCYCYLKQNNYR